MALKKIQIGLHEIKKILPHREPFLFVDRVTGLEDNVRIRAERDLRPDEPHFAGHFPKNPIMPGVLTTEALAQTSGLLLGLSADDEDPGLRGSLFYLAKADIKWSAPARPGNTLILESKHVRTLASLVAFSVKAFTKTNDIAVGTLTLAQVNSKR